MTPPTAKSSAAPPYGEDPPEVFDLDTATVDEVVAEVSRLASHSISAARALVERGRSRFPGEPRLERWDQVLAPPVVSAVADVARTTGREMRAWLSKHGRTHVGRWVVIDHDELVAVGATFEEIRPALARRPSAVAVEVVEELLGG